MVAKLSSVFASGFRDFRHHKFSFPLFTCLFDLVPENTADCFQLDIIELQASVDLRRTFNQNDLLTFYSSFVHANYSKLEYHAKK